MAGFMKGLINPDDKERDAKLLAFCLVVLFGIGKLCFSEITDQWVNAFYGLCTLVGLGGPAFAAVEKWKGGAGAPQPPQTTGTTNQGEER